MEQIVIEVSQEGETKVLVEGCAGPSCKALTADIEKALGEVTDDKKTADYLKTSQKENLKQC